MSAERRIVHRKQLSTIVVQEITLLSTYATIVKGGKIVDASPRGFLVMISRKDLVPKNLRNNLDLSELIGKRVAMHLPQMGLDLDGIVKRTRHRGHGQFEVGIKFSDDVPEYWRECLVDLLPSPGEFDEV